MTKTKGIAYIILCMVVCYFIGYGIGVTKTVLLQSSSNGEYGYVNVCDVNSEYKDENDNCRNFDKARVHLKIATDIEGRIWGSYGAAAGFFVGLSLVDYLDKKHKRKKH